MHPFTVKTHDISSLGINPKMQWHHQSCVLADILHAYFMHI